MDDLDVNLLEAFDRVLARCRRDPALAMRRWWRSREAHSGPPREWCLKLRASDHRIGEYRACIVPRGAIERQEEHEVTIGGEEVRRLCGPVSIPWPGVRLTEAARLLGRHKEAVWTWLGLRMGHTRAERAAGPAMFQDHYPPGSPLGVRYEKAQCHGLFGRDVPVVWSATALDPGAAGGEAPHALWGSLWQSRHEKLPDEFAVEVKRIPRWGVRGGKRRFLGWNFLCPGFRGGPTCGRTARLLYGPLPLWTIGKAMGEAVELEIEGKKVRLGVDDPLAGRRSFACERCWRVASLHLTDRRGWNQFVAYISGGLLYGREVKRPPGFKFTRKRAYAPRAGFRGLRTGPRPTILAA